jgi:hypothetical protein
MIEKLTTADMAIIVLSGAALWGVVFYLCCAYSDSDRCRRLTGRREKTTER